jgi:Fic family protein
MYRPNFNYNHKIVNLLLEINSIRDYIVNAPQSVEMEIILKRDALIKSAHHSTAIEGNQLSLNQVDKLSQDQKINVYKKAKQEVLNYLNVLKNLDKYEDHGKITKNSILKLQKDITHKTLEFPYLEGSYRATPAYIFNEKGEKVFTPTPANLIYNVMQEFLEWINNPGELNPVIVAGIIHYEFVRIHPFADGNGRTARALAALYLKMHGFSCELFTLDEYYDNDRSAYYNALNSVKNQILTPWLEYFLEGFLISITAVKDQIMLLSPEKTQKRIKLSPKQRKIIEYINLNGSINNLELQKLLNISRQGAYKDLKKLVDMNLLKKNGGGRSTYYILNTEQP